MRHHCRRNVRIDASVYTLNSLYSTSTFRTVLLNFLRDIMIANLLPTLRVGIKE